MLSIISFNDICSIFKAAAFLSSLTRDNRSFIILVSLSISAVISVMNSLYISMGASGNEVRESARTLTDARGVFNSCDTLDTNSCLDCSRLSVFSLNFSNSESAALSSIYLGT